MKDYVKENQPVVYKILYNEFVNKRIPHAFLLHGEDTEQEMMFLAMSLICKEDVLACEKCNDCRRVKEGIYADILHYDGNKAMIHTEDIEHIQKRFLTSSIEGGARIYILENIERSSPKALNSLLKILEEPQPGIYAIFTTKNIHRVLPTIQSRCQILEIKPYNKNILIDKLVKNNIMLEDANILAEFTNSYEDAIAIKDDRYDYIKTEAVSSVEDLFFKRENLLINTHIHIMRKYKDKDEIRLFLNLICLLLRDLFHVKHGTNLVFVTKKEFYQSIQVSDEELIRKIELVLQAINDLETNANVPLLMDRLMIEL